MKFDLTKLPLGEALIGFVLAAVAVTFVLAFIIGTDDGGIEGGEASEDGSPTPQASPTEDGSPPAGNLIVMGDNFFEFEGEREPTIAVAQGEEVTVDLTNDGLAVHNMPIAGSDNEYAVNFCEGGGEEPCSDPELFTGGDAGSITFSFDEAGSFVFRCDFHPTEMVGTFTVE